ncbi:MAG: type II secretion system F family protein [archaeon]
MYKIISRMYPRKLREDIKELLASGGDNTKVEKFIGFTFIFSVILAILVPVSLIIFMDTALHYSLNLGIGVVIFFLMQIGSYLNLILKADGKAKFIESILPDALQLTASNLKAGYTVERALLLSARPEFGMFSDQLTNIGKEIATGRSIEEALIDITRTVKSKKLEKTMMLIVQGIASGGELAILLSQTAQNLRNQMLVEKRMQSSAMAYFIFILSAVAFASPVLFALSSFLAEVIKKQISSIEMPKGLSIPISVNAIPISSNFVLGFIIITLATLCICGSLALGFIKKGDLKEGIRYMPMLLGFSLGMFFFVRWIINNIFSGIV